MYRLRGRRHGREVVALTGLSVGLLLLQAGLGIATLLTGDPLSLALAHQANAAVLLSVAVGLAWRSYRPGGNILPLP
jgi:heme a synthase